jgi:hypothetical protein
MVSIVSLGHCLHDQFLDRDDQTATGDHETLVDLIKEGKAVCRNPLDGVCQTLAGAPASPTG